MGKRDTKGEQNATLPPRPPVVVVLGHVDHGKTTLLDRIRKTNIVAREAGGITQHIGASVISHAGRTMTFIDTPGHAAFAAMRARGARVADIAILVVAADDGVKPQTEEAIEAIRAADIPFIVAINKIDKANADIERTKTSLTEAGILLEGWGGDTPVIEISAKQGIGIDALLDLITLVADIAELHADPSKPAEGVVIEAHRDAKRGVAATLLVKDGTLKVGDILAVGATTGRVKSLEDFRGNPTSEVGPSMPAVVLGLAEVPDVGDPFRVMPDEVTAQQAARSEASRRAFEQRIAEGTPKEELPLILKADVMGSLEAIVHELEKLRNTIVAIRIVGADTGEVTENDVKRAQTVGATIVAFRVKTRPPIATLAERSNITVITGNVIYELIDRVREAVLTRVPKHIRREELGRVELLATFRKDPPRQVVGGRVIEGMVRKGARFELVRGEEEKGSGDILEVQRGKVAVDEAEKGNECGILLRFRSGGFAESGDTLRVFNEIVEVPKLWNS